MDAGGTAPARIPAESRHVVSAAGANGSPGMAACDRTEAIPRSAGVPNYTSRCRSVEAAARVARGAAARSRISPGPRERPAIQREKGKIRPRTAASLTLRLSRCSRSSLRDALRQVIAKLRKKEDSLGGGRPGTDRPWCPLQPRHLRRPLHRAAALDFPWLPREHAGHFVDVPV